MIEFIDLPLEVIVQIVETALNNPTCGDVRSVRNVSHLFRDIVDHIWCPHALKTNIREKSDKSIFDIFRDIGGPGDCADFNAKCHECRCNCLHVPSVLIGSYFTPALAPQTRYCIQCYLNHYVENTAGTTGTTNLRIYAMTYNIMRMMGGGGGLRYQN
jgi:hypothetical protein